MIKTGQVATVFATLILVGVGCGAPQPPDVPPYIGVNSETGVGDLHDYLLAYSRAYGVPAMAAAVVTSDSVVAIGAAGVRVRGGTDSVTIDDKWHIGSNTKSMTATLAAILVRDSLISWDSRIVDVLGDDVKAIDSGWNEATLQQLLAHTAAAPPAINERYPDLWQALRSDSLDPNQQRLETARTVLADPPVSTPGAKYAYSNSGYMIAGLMLELAAGVQWEEMIVDSLLRPIGVNSAGFGAPGKRGSSAESREPWGHDAGGDPFEPGPSADNPSGLGPAGTVHMTIRDWSRYAQLHLRGDVGRASLLDSSAFAILHRPPSNAVEPYTMGWQITDEVGPSTRVLKHDGSNTLWFAMIWIPLEKDFAIVVAANQGGANAREAVDQALWNIALDHLERY